MASVVNRKGCYYVVYLYVDEEGRKKQKWETCKSEADAERRKKELEFKEEFDHLKFPKCKTVTDLLDEYVTFYGKRKWSLSVYTANKALIKHYITPYIGKMNISEVSPRVLERYYQKLQNTESVDRVTDSKFRKETRLVGASTVRDVHKLLRSAFTQAMKWELIDKNPALLAEIPKYEAKKREIWDLETIARVNEICPDPMLKLCINLAFACSLRIGELLGLTWDCVDISDESMEAGNANIIINKELQRVYKAALKELENKDVIVAFPEATSKSKTQLVLKKPKTLSSVRRVYLPKSVAGMLREWKQRQDEVRKAFGDEYYDYNLVIAGQLGTPVESRRIEKCFRDFIKNNDLPNVVFHSLRHSSITYKLKLTGGDIKAVQGDSGHSQAQMVTDQYSHILDENRKENARLLENAFYKKTDASKEEETMPAEPSEKEQIDFETVSKLMANPEIAELLLKLSKAAGLG